MEELLLRELLVTEIERTWLWEAVLWSPEPQKLPGLLLMRQPLQTEHSFQLKNRPPPLKDVIKMFMEKLSFDIEVRIR